MPNTIFAHGATGGVGVQGYATGASTPSSLITLGVKSWEATEDKDVENVSNTSSPGYKVNQPGKKELNVTIEAWLPLVSAGNAYDQGHNPLSATGPDLEADYCYLNLVGGLTASGSAATVTPTSNNSIFNIPCAVVKSFKISNVEATCINYTITAVSSGSYTINSGS